MGSLNPISTWRRNLPTCNLTSCKHFLLFVRVDWAITEFLSFSLQYWHQAKTVRNNCHWLIKKMTNQHNKDKRRIEERIFYQIFIVRFFYHWFHCYATLKFCSCEFGFRLPSIVSYLNELHFLPLAVTRNNGWIYISVIYGSGHCL